MNSKLLKVVLPLLTFMVAAVFAFATEQKSSGDETLTTGYIFKNGVCQSAPRDCNNQGSILCKYNDGINTYQVYSNGISCTFEMTHRP